MLDAEHKRLQATFHQAAVGICHVAPDGRFLDANQKLCDILGYSKQELLERTVIDVTHPDDRQLSEGQRRKLLAEGTASETCGCEKRYLRKNGKAVWVAVSLTVVRNDAGETECFVALVQDITERKAVEESLRVTVDQAAVGIVHTNVDRRYLMVNQKFCDMLGYSREELLAMRSDEVTHPDDRDQDIGYKRGLLDGSLATYSGEKRYIRKDGSVIWVNRSASLARDESGTPYFIRVIEDITARKEAEAHFRATFEQAAAGIAHMSLDGRYLRANQKLCDLLGYTHEELQGKTAREVSHSDDYVDGLARRQRLLAGEAVEICAEKRYLRKDGSVVYANRSASLVRGPSGEPSYILAVVTDITAQKLAEQVLLESEEKFRQLAEHIPQVFWMTDADQQAVIYVSPAYESITGRSLAELQADPRSWLGVIHEDDRDHVRKARRSQAPLSDYDIEYRIKHTDGTVRWIHDRAFPVRNAQGKIYRIAGIGEDITERKRAEEQLVQLAHYDTLTGLPNRALFHDRLQQTLKQARRNDWTIGVLFLDLDRFKLVNDTLGHSCGDKLLQQVAQRLMQCLRTGDTAGRLSGDEFAVILSELAAAQDASLVAQKILKALALPFDLDGNEVFVSASIGITLYPLDSMEPDALLKNADAAMYSAKAHGRNNYQYYTESMNERAVARMQLEMKLRRALEREEFVLHYQPKLNTVSGEIAGFEALLRWQTPGNGLVSPDQFIPLLEETGLIVPVGEWVLRAACAQIRAWQTAGVKPVPVAVNVSARQFQQSGFSEMLQQLLDEHGIDPGQLEIEITESSLMEDPEAAIIVLKQIRALGIRLSVDDFGTGYSSLGYLKRFPLDALKIDRTFVRDATSDPDDAAITRTVTALAHSLGLKVVAEGVETEEQLAFLDAIRCDEAQGYLFSRPLPAGDCTAILAAGRRLHAPRVAGSAGVPPAVLLLDDDQNNLLLTARLLQKDGYQILAAVSTREAFDLLATHAVGVVVSDQQMPDMSGVEFFNRVKRMYPEVVRIMLSGSEDFRTATAAINLGEVHKFFVKGRDEEQLCGEIRKAFWRTKAHGQPNSYSRDGTMPGTSSNQSTT